jgi:hypothetical protein
MITNIFSKEIPDEVKEEISFLYKIGVNAEELDYLIRTKIKKR